MHDGNSEEATRQLREAIHNHNLPAIKALIDAGADVNSPGPSGNFPLHEAASRGHTAAVALLLEKGAVLDCRNCDGKTPQELARANRHDRLAELLEQHAQQQSHAARAANRRQGRNTPDIGN